MKLEKMNEHKYDCSIKYGQKYENLPEATIKHDCYLATEHELTFRANWNKKTCNKILLQKVFEGEFIHVIAYAENKNCTTYSSHPKKEKVVQKCSKICISNKSKCSKICVFTRIDQLDIIDEVTNLNSQSIFWSAIASSSRRKLLHPAIKWISFHWKFGDNTQSHIRKHTLFYIK